MTGAAHGAAADFIHGLHGRIPANNAGFAANAATSTMRLRERLSPSSDAPGLWDRFAEMRRRQGWLFENLTPAKLVNLLLAGIQFSLKHQVMRAWPVIVKIDISPACNLACPSCVHADASDTSPEELKRQSFNVGRKMSVAQYRGIINEISGKTMAVSLYYVGDPLMHADLDEMCRIAREAKLNCHIS